jgi:hypothetical protein
MRFCDILAGLLAQFISFATKILYERLVLLVAELSFGKARLELIYRGSVEESLGLGFLMKEALRLAFGAQLSHGDYSIM